MADARELEVVLYGATGFTGRLVAEFLTGRYGAGLRLGLAGRDRGKLAALRDALSARRPELASMPLIVADAVDRGALRELAARTQVVATTAGPYARYGDLLVAACAEQGTDLCDLAGEVAWMQRTIDAHHREAEASGARIVHVCGFDSIPSDLGTFMVQAHAREKHGAPCREVNLYVIASKGSFSGGTLATLGNSLDEAARDPDARRAGANPYALNPEGERSGPDGSAQMGLRHDPVIDAWTGPFPMAPINEPVVRRSNALLGWAYGRDFRYHESVRLGRGPKGAVKAAAVTAGLGAFGGAMYLKPTRWALERFVLPAPGEGPSREAQEAGFFVVRLVGRGEDAEGRAFEVRGEVAGDRDPGYGATAMMLGEAAVSLARDQADGLSGGVLTPASALGHALIARLREVGFTFAVS